MRLAFKRTTVANGTYTRKQHKSLICYTSWTSFASPYIKKIENSDLDESQKWSNRVHEPRKSAFPRTFLLTLTAAWTSHQALSTDKIEDEVFITHVVINERTSC